MGGMGIVGFCDYLDLTPNYLDSTSIGGSSFVAHTAHAAGAIASGLCEVALIVYGSSAASQRFAVGTGGFGGSPDPCDQYEVPFGVTTVGSYAMIAQRHMHEYGTTSEQLAEIAVTMRLHASMNPQAKYRDPITVEDVLASRIISSPLHLLDCCIISDGGGALVVTSAARARDLKKKPVYILGAGETVRHAARGTRDFLEIAAAQSGRLAFERAGVAHKDIDMAMIYDSFTITVLTTLENLGFCKRGEGGAFVTGGRLRYRRRPAAQHRRRRSVIQPSRDARDLPGDRSGQTVARRMRSAPGQGLQDRAGPRHRRHARHPPFRRDADLCQSVARSANPMADEKRKYTKPLPHMDEENRPWWEALKRHELYLQKCRDCGDLATIRARYVPNACRRAPNGSARRAAARSTRSRSPIRTRRRDSANRCPT